MKRRAFLKDIMAMGALGTLQASGALTLMGCAPGNGNNPETPNPDAYDFDEILDRSTTWSIKHLRAMQMGGDKIPMWIADMDFRTAPFMTQAYRDRIALDAFGYTRTPQEFYDAVAQWETQQHGWKVAPEWVTYVPGVITSMAQAILCFTEPGDKILLQPPVYDPFRGYTERLGRVAVDNPLLLREGKYHMDLDHLESLIDPQTKALILCNPHNPGGMMWGKEELQRLASICAKHQLLVFSDEIHGDLALYGNQHVPFCSVSEEAARVGLIFTGPTKAFNLAGISTAHALIPNPELREKYIKHMEDRKLDEAPIFSLISTITAYTHPTHWLEALRTYLEGNIDYVAQFMQREIPQIRVLKPQASFLVWLDCRELHLEQKALVSLFLDKAGIVVNNGANYGPGGEGFIRLNIGCPRSIVEKAMQRLKQAIG